eukprot:CAMPEP_0173195534 /NCGR_PEP_ID=MMETSP1141-20130122/15114_1 /TAXON_ID=483371 /ORGANISM="non described non described, Strain CCMP2298" /LENGTH=67 /DNA_ID=CAMNT_0014120085 /DNA_START=98 /DNA_END=301 /DNA_ORIENTATION=+
MPLITTLYALQGPQNMPPQSRQWCLRVVSPNFLLQLAQFFTSLSSTHVPPSAESLNAAASWATELLL